MILQKRCLNIKIQLCLVVRFSIFFVCSMLCVHKRLDNEEKSEHQLEKLCFVIYANGIFTRKLSFSEGREAQQSWQSVSMEVIFFRGEMKQICVQFCLCKCYYHLILRLLMSLNYVVYCCCSCKHQLWNKTETRILVIIFNHEFTYCTRNRFRGICLLFLEIRFLN